jgi:translocation and assembly module TamB
MLPEPQLTARLEGEAELSGSYPLDFGLDWGLEGAPSLQLKGRASIGGDLSRVTLEHDLKGSAEADLEAVVEGVLDAPRWTATLEVRGADLGDLQDGLPALALTGWLRTEGDLDEARVQGSLSGDAPELPDLGRLAVNLEMTWRAQVLEVAGLELTEQRSGARLDAEGRLDLSGVPESFDLEAAWENLRWPLTGISLAEVRQGKLDASGSFDAYRFSLSAQGWGRDVPEVVLRLQGDGDRRGAALRSLDVDTLGGRIEARGTLAWAPELGWDLAVQAHDIDTSGQWPEIPAKLKLALESRGGLAAFEYSLDGLVDAHTGPIPSASLNLSGAGDRRGTRIEGLRLSTLGGVIEGRGEMGWAPVVSWDARLDLAGVDPGQHWPDWPGRLQGHLESAGGLSQDGAQLTARLDGLSGVLRGYPVEGRGAVAMRGGDIRIEDVSLASGPSRLRADGVIGEALDLGFDLNSPDLGTLLPEAGGSIQASGSVKGKVSAPDIALDLAADGLDLSGQGIKRLRGKANLQLVQGGQVAVDFSGERLIAGGIVFDNLRLEADGKTGAHRLNAAAEGERLGLELSAAGGLKEDKVYAGEVRELRVRSSDFGLWRLQRPAPVLLSGVRLGAGPVCLRDALGSGGCARFERVEAASWTAELDLEKLDFALLAPYVPEGLLLTGQVEAKANFEAVGGTLKGRADLRVPEGVLTADREAEGQLLNFSSARLDLDADRQGLAMRMVLPLAGLGGADADLSLPGWRLDAPAREAQGLRGRVQLRIDDLALVSRLVPDVTGVRGNINADLALSGSLGRPGVSGYARLNDGGLQVPLVGLKVEQLGFIAETEGSERIAYSGGFNAGEGRLEIEGETLLGKGDMITRVTATGKRLKLADSPEYLLLASPDIRFEAGAMGATLRGDVDVPKARIRPRSIPAGTVTPSPDVVMVAEVDRSSIYPVSLDLRLILGENVQIDAFGLRGRLKGDLRVLQKPGRDVLGDGQLEVVDGTYRFSTGSRLTAAIGKPLKIEQGLLVFAKTPVSNPALLLTAKREGGDITAGVRVFGTIRNPKLAFFSESDPGLSQSEVSSYLLTGIPPRGSTGEAPDRSLSVGTYVAPKLFMEYDYGLGDESDKVKLRYDLNNWVELQTETGESQGGDIFLKFER